jgi:hypothetical protein
MVSFPQAFPPKLLQLLKAVNKLQVNVDLDKAMMAQMGSTGIFLLFL